MSQPRAKKSLEPAVPRFPFEELGEGVLLLHVSGRITLGRSCQEFEAAIDQHFANGWKKIILDFSKLERVDSSGLWIVVLAAGKLKNAGGGLLVAGATGVVREVFAIVKVDTIVTCCRTVEDATRLLRT